MLGQAVVSEILRKDSSFYFTYAMPGLCLTFGPDIWLVGNDLNIGGTTTTTSGGNRGGGQLVAHYGRLLVSQRVHSYVKCHRRTFEAFDSVPIHG